MKFVQFQNFYCARDEMIRDDYYYIATNILNLFIFEVILHLT
jgi:hypothetical protein